MDIKINELLITRDGDFFCRAKVYGNCLSLGANGVQEQLS